MRVIIENRYVLLLILCSFFWATACDDPGQIGGPTPEPPAPAVLEALDISCYPGNEIIFYDYEEVEVGLFCTDIRIPNLSFIMDGCKLLLHYDTEILAFESYYSPGAVAETSTETGVVEIRLTDCAFPPGQGIELGSVTWKSLVTGFSSVSLEAEWVSGRERGEIALPPPVIAPFRIVKELGSLTLRGEPFIEKGAIFSRTIALDTEGEVIREYDLEIVYDADKIRPAAASIEDAVSVGTDGFLSTLIENGNRIRVTGSSVEGSGPGEELEFLLSRWEAIDSGRALLSINVHKLVTAENVYLKPSVFNNVLSIQKDSNKPVLKIWCEPAVKASGVGDSFMTTIYLNTEGYVLSAYSINIIYDEQFLALDKSQAGGNGLEAGPDGFLTVFNSEEGYLRMAGVSVNGVQPNPELDFLRIYWNALAPVSSTEIQVEAESLADARSNEIALFQVSHCLVTISE